MFNFKNPECQKMFFEVTSKTDKLSKCFKVSEESFEKQSKRFFKVLNQTFHQCFKKIRITNKPRKINMKDDLQRNLYLKTKLCEFFNCCKSDLGRSVAEQKLQQVEQIISKLSADRNKMAIDEQIGNLQTINGSFSNHGMWKVKAKLLARPHDPPMAKNDQHGNLITARGPLKKLYLDTYVHRLRNREIKREYQDILILKSALWSERLESLKESKTK